MKQRIHFIALATSLAMAAALPCAGADSAVKPYTWVDKDGVRHFSDTIPPEFSTRERAELNSQGVPMREFPRQLTPEEAAIAQKEAAEKQRRRQHDSYLLTTYTRVEDIERLRDERLALIDGQMELARGSLASADQRLLSQQQRMGNFKPYSSSATARRLPDNLAEEVVRTLHERRSAEATLASREKEKTELRAEFDQDIARYRELTTRPAR